MLGVLSSRQGLSGAVGLARRDRPRVHWASPDTGPGSGPQRQQAERSLRNGFSPLGRRLFAWEFLGSVVGIKDH